MPVKAWSPKRERQYEHIKEGLEDRGTDEDTAEEIAARTVNKERARAGESKEASRTSIEDISSGRRGGLRSHSAPAGGPTRSYATRPPTATSTAGRR
jgi:plasmid stabilization system protein ParE